MSPKPRPLALHPKQSSRRSFLTLTALTAAGVPVVAGCRLSRAGSGGGGGVSGGGGAGSSGAASPAPDGWQDLDGHLLGHRVSVRVSPLVRVSEEATALVLELTRAADDAAVADVQSSESGSDDSDNTVYASTSLGRPLPARGASGVRLIDTAGAGRVWTAGSASGGTLELKPGETVSSTVVFTPVDLDEVTVLVPQTGFVRVRVIDRDAAADVGVSSEALGKADKIIQDNSGPGDKAAVVPLERYTRALDDSTGTRTTDKDVTVTLASDVTFDSDSYNLTAAADAQLQTVADQIAQYPDGGNLDIVGHTDDVADNAHNQTLSENRAGTVKDRLGQLAALAKWQITTTGKGETEPAINDTTDEARAANRRVVITITPTSGTTAKQPGTTGTATPSAPPASDTGLPEAQGPVGTGPDGVTVPGPDGKGQITITLDHVTRNGGLLTAQLTITTGPGGTDDATLTTWLKDPAQAFASSRGENGGASAVGIANGLTLLADGQRLYPTDYLPPDSTWHHPLTELYTYKPLKEGATTTVCVVWPDTGQDTVTLDHPGHKNNLSYVFRLTDIPVITA
ncbi:OmpA family protein [Actinomyces massiliensis]|uniref:OmpA family protein n=1 Tax=Actinomyces massiliensis TaxID=461393 RepID=UPI0003024DEB|nr:OmpA family protein [Actinomyces massiliensis]